MNTKPPADNNVTSVWTPADEARLQELAERKRRIYAAHMDALHEVMLMIVGSESDPPINEMVNRMTAYSDNLIAALTPFATPKGSA